MTPKPPRWLVRNVEAIAGPPVDVNGALAAAHDTDAEREGFVPARLSGAQLLSTVTGALAAAHDTDAEREGFIPARLSDTALRAAFDALRPSTAVFLGNSFTANGVGSNGDRVERGWWVWLQALTGHRLKVANVAGISGQRLDEFTARVATDVTPYAPGWVFVDGPTNDISQGFDLATIQTRFLALLAAVTPARVVAYTVPPNTPNTAAQNQVRDRYNDWLRRLPNSRATAALGVRLIVAEVHDVLATPGAETLNAAYTYDGTHPNGDGALLLGQAVANAVAPALPGALNSQLSAGADSLNLLGSSSAFINPTSGLAAGWTNGDPTNGVPSIVASTDGIAANWQRMTVAPAGTSCQLYARPSGWAVGDTLFAAVECRVSALSPVSGAFPHYYLRATMLGAAGTPSVFALANLTTGRTVVPGGVLTLKTEPITVPAGTTNVQIGLISFGGMTIDWRRPRLAKVSTAIA
jgi:lysophospholipase L1-like esterase